MTTQIQIRRDTAANWNNVDPVLAEGEIGMDMTVNSFKVGDGVSAWSAIDYAGSDISLDDYYTKVEVDDAFQPKGDYLTEFVEEDPTVPDHVKGITQDDIDGWNAGGGSGGNIADGTTDGIVATWDSTAGDDGAGQWTPDSSLTIDAAGDATFSGSVSSSGTMTPSSGLKTWLWVHGNNDQIGLTINATENRLVPYGDSKDVMDLGATSSKFKDAYFSGAVNTVWLFAGEDGANLVVGAGGGGGNFNRIQIMKPDDPMCFRVNSTTSNGVGADAFKVDQQGNCTAKGTVDAAGLTVNGSPIGGGGGGLPDGGYTYGWSITASDFIATSDERVKDNITTAPVGLIDSLKGREWDWKESGEKGSGVVAQELEQVLPHLVHTDDAGMKSVAYNGLVAYLIEEVKALRAEVEALK